MFWHAACNVWIASGDWPGSIEWLFPERPFTPEKPTDPDPLNLLRHPAQPPLEPANNLLQTFPGRNYRIPPMRVFKMDSLHTELTNCQFFQSSLLNLMRALREDAEEVEESEQAESKSPAGSTPPTVV
jgi:hypothetical protein